MPRPSSTERMVRTSYSIPAIIKSFIRKRAYEQNKTETEVLKEILYAGKGLIEASEGKIETLKPAPPPSAPTPKLGKPGSGFGIINDLMGGGKDKN